MCSYGKEGRAAEWLPLTHRPLPSSRLPCLIAVGMGAGADILARYSVSERVARHRGGREKSKGREGGRKGGRDCYVWVVLLTCCCCGFCYLSIILTFDTTVLIPSLSLSLSLSLPSSVPPDGVSWPCSGAGADQLLPTVHHLEQLLLDSGQGERDWDGGGREGGGKEEI